MPLISVIVPVYKVEPYLRRCVDSILAQTFTDFELILVDDGSPDNCGAICDEYAQKDSRVYVIHQENGGLSAARNAGIDWVFAHSDSEWISFVDSDDWVHPEYLERLLYAALDNDVGISICGYDETKGEDPEINADELTPQIWNPEGFFVEYVVNATVAWGKLYRKECFENLRYPVGRIHEDEYITYILLFNCSSIAYIKASLYSYYINHQGIIRSPWSLKRLDTLTAFEQQLEFFSKKGYTRCYQLRLKTYGRQLAQACWHVGAKNSEGYDKALSRELRAKLRATIIKMHVIGIWDHETDQVLYDAAFPHLMAFYWILQAAKKKIRDEGLGCAVQKGIHRILGK